MKGSRPDQAVLTRDTDMSKTSETRAVIEGMVDGLNDHTIDGIGAFFKESFRWMGNTGCGHKNGLTEFQDNWQRPFQAAFSDRRIRAASWGSPPPANGLRSGIWISGKSATARSKTIG